MNEQRRLTDKIKFIAGLVTAIVVIVSTLTTVYSWYFVGKDTCIKVGKIEKKVYEDLEPRLIEEEKKSSVQFEINKKLDSVERKLDILIMRK